MGSLWNEQCASSTIRYIRFKYEVLLIDIQGIVGVA